MLHVIALHGMSCHLEECWLESVIENLKKLGITDFQIPHFPLLKEITLEKWDDILIKYKDIFDENLVIIAHSLSTNFIVRFLYKHKLSAQALIAVGGGYEDKEFGELGYLAPFIPSASEFEYVKNSIKNRFHIYSDDDTIWTQNQIEKYNKLLSPIEIKTHGCGHYGRTSKVKDIPQIYEIVKSLK